MVLRRLKTILQCATKANKILECLVRGVSCRDNEVNVRLYTCSVSHIILYGVHVWSHVTIQERQLHERGQKTADILQFLAGEGEENDTPIHICLA